MVKVPLGIIVTYIFEKTGIASAYYLLSRQTKDTCGCSERQKYLNKWMLPLPKFFEKRVRAWHIDRVSKDLATPGGPFPQSSSKLLHIQKGISLVDAFNLVSTYRNQFTYKIDDPEIRSFVKLNGYQVAED